jgi:hypothetical protein
LQKDLKEIPEIIGIDQGTEEVEIDDKIVHDLETETEIVVGDQEMEKEIMTVVDGMYEQFTVWIF